MRSPWHDPEALEDARDEHRQRRRVYRCTGPDWCGADDCERCHPSQPIAPDHKLDPED